MKPHANVVSVPAPTAERERMTHVVWADDMTRALCGMTGNDGELVRGQIECVVCAALIEQAIARGEAEEKPAW